jgi:serine/threonine protein phosphatase PrpC
LSTQTEIDLQTDVVPCRVCESPVFDDELYCEACGAAVKPEAPPATVTRPRATRDERDLSVIAAVTDVGLRRIRNEDAFAIAQAGGRCVAAVCDGVASTANGDRAARAAADAALEVLEPLLHAAEWPDEAGLAHHIESAFDEAQQAVLRVPDDDPYGNDASPSTTLVVAVATSDRVVVGSVGDSRAYWLSTGGAQNRVLTVDDSVAQEEIARGVPAEDAYGHPDAHSITRWVGADTDSWTPNVATLAPTEPGNLVVCTDGLWNHFDDPDRLAGLVTQPGPPPPPLEIARLLAKAALDAGGQDNVTVAVIPLDPSGPSGRESETGD